MYCSIINIKHGCLTHLFWGRNKDTGEYIHIHDVKKNGLDCNCQCPVCSGTYIACMGKKNRPYFKHQSKYACMYTDEITTYLRAKKLLETAKSISLPDLPVRFGAHIFAAKGYDSPIEDVSYHCDEEQYPPLLIATIDQRPMRILFAFEGYYNAEDLSLIQAEAEQNKWDCLIIKMPKVDTDDCISDVQLQSIVIGASARKSWLHSELEQYWQQRLEESSAAPATVIAGTSEARKCPIHKHLYRGQYFASCDDCEKCIFNLGTGKNCRCAAQTGITCISDFDISKELRQHRVEKLRIENERAIEAHKRAEELSKYTKQQREEQLKMGFYISKTCPKCGKKLKEMRGKNGMTWLCLNGCKFHAFESYGTGELITQGMD